MSPAAPRIHKKNVYEVLESERGGCFLLKCVQFSEVEDLGDGIRCTGKGEEIWVAGYFVRNLIDAR